METKPSCGLSCEVTDEIHNPARAKGSYGVMRVSHREGWIVISQAVLARLIPLLW
jgi:hypothetical protein